MTIAKRLSRANRIATTEKNTVVGTLEFVDVVTSEIVDQDTGELISTDQIEWIFEVDTALGVKTKIHEWTGLSVNAEKTYRPENGNPTYNKLTTILLAGKLLTEKELASYTEEQLEELDIESLKGKTFEFELEHRNKKRNLKSIKLSTLKLLS